MDLREQLNERKSRILEGETTEEQIHTELIKMRMEEQRAMKDITNLQDTLRDLQDSRIGNKKFFQIETKALLSVKDILREKEEEFEKFKIQYEDENEIKNVLMMRIKDLENQLKVKEEETEEVCTKLENIKINQNSFKEKIEETNLRIKAISENHNRIENIRRKSVQITLEKETEYKAELIKEAHEKQELSQELKKLAYKVKSMQECLCDKNTQIENIDQKIGELIKIRRKMCGKICDLRQSELSFIE